MATKFPLLPHYPINADDRACLSALDFVFICVYMLCWNAKNILWWACFGKSSVLISLEWNVKYIQRQVIKVSLYTTQQVFGKIQKAYLSLSVAMQLVLVSWKKNEVFWLLKVWQNNIHKRKCIHLYCIQIKADTTNDFNWRNAIRTKWQHMFLIHLGELTSKFCAGPAPSHQMAYECLSVSEVIWRYQNASLAFPHVF